ncbi:MAG: hypothetical protein PHN29_04880 [Endomicrobiaceae bacterium]|nr:hypothetical protein [Endomicrobiaceae bacterium]
MFLNLKEIYLPAWQIFLKNWWEYIVVTLVRFILVFITFVVAILQVFVIFSIINAMLKAVKNNQINFSDFLKFKDIFNFKTVAFAAVLGIYYFLIQNFPSVSILLSLFGAVLSVIFFPVFCVLIDKNFTIKDTILYSAKLTKGVRAEIVFIMLMNLLIGIAGAFLLFVGVFVAMPVALIATVKVYTLLENRLNSQTPQI